jgi:hypothetical protein
MPLLGSLTHHVQTIAANGASQRGSIYFLLPALGSSKKKPTNKICKIKKESIVILSL